jgi:deltex-like protein
MKRTRRQMLKEELDKDSEDEEIIKVDKKKKYKKDKKDEKETKIEDRDKKNIQENLMRDNVINSDVKGDDISFNQEFLELIEKIKKNLQTFEMKPEYCDKPIDEKNKNISQLHKITKFKLISPIEIYYKLKHEEYNKHSLEDDKCSICLFNFYEDDLKEQTLDEILKFNKSKKNEYDAILLNNCSDHFFHLECIMNLFGDKESAKCPNCNKIYGILTGDQPKGRMNVELNEGFSCDGYEDVGTIAINYNFPNGRGYSGTSRTAYLPNNKEGREVLALFKVAFDRKLLFTVGTSVTTGQENTTVWNGIHHKTNTSGGPQYFGYPDSTYFNRVKQELAAKGVVEENINESLETIADDLLPKGAKNKCNKGRKKK